jgi:hypothetical protein
VTKSSERVDGELESVRGVEHSGDSGIGGRWGNQSGDNSLDERCSEDLRGILVRDSLNRGRYTYSELLSSRIWPLSRSSTAAS